MWTQHERSEDSGGSGGGHNTIEFLEKLLRLFCTVKYVHMTNCSSDIYWVILTD